MSEFEAIIDLISSVVRFAIDKTVDLICVCLLVASCIFPWRIAEIINDPDMSDNNWHCESVVHFFLTIFDCIAVPLSFVALVSPLRWIQVFYVCKQYRYSRAWEARFKFLFASCCAICDIITAPLGIICLVFPLRSSVVRRCTLAYLRLSLDSRGIISTDDEYADSILAVNFLWYTQFYNGLIDILFIIPGMVE